MHLVEDVVHGIVNRAGNRTIDRRRRGLVCLGARVGHDAPRRDSAALERPDIAFVPVISVDRILNLRQRLGDALVGSLDVFIDRRPGLRLKSILGIPNGP